MRMIVATALLFLSTAARADAIGERTSRDLAHPPTANDVIGGLNAFGRFQQGLLESADLKGNEEIRNIAARRAEDAAKRDRTLKQIQTDIGAEPGTGKPPAISGSLVGPDDSEGPAYVRKFYAAQIIEYESAIGLLQRYLQAPDNNTLGAFARAQLPILRAELRGVERVIADK